MFPSVLKVIGFGHAKLENFRLKQGDSLGRKEKTRQAYGVFSFFVVFLNPVLKLLMLFFWTDRRGQMSYLGSGSEIWG